MALCDVVGALRKLVVHAKPRTGATALVGVTPLLRIVVQFADGREHQTDLEAAGTETVLRSDPQGANLVVRQVDWPQPGIATALSAQVVGETPPSVTPAASPIAASSAIPAATASP